MKSTTKKKTKRLDSRRVLEGEIAARRKKFYDSGAPVSLVMLFIFILVIFCFPPRISASSASLRFYKVFYRKEIFSVSLCLCGYFNFFGKE